MAGKGLDSVLEQWGCEEIEPIEFYRRVFRLGEGYIQKKNEPSGEYKTNPIAVVHNGAYATQRIMFEDEFESYLEEFKDCKWAIMSGLTYWGKNNTAERQSKMYALIFDLDDVTPETLNNLLDGAFSDYYPLPNLIVMSGHGVHLYYLFEEPVSLYPETKTQMKGFKHALTCLLWNKETSTNPDVQYQPINQGFRVPGTKTKIEGVSARAFLVSDHRIDIDYLNDFVDEQYRVDVSRVYRERKYSLEEAKELFPEWYERVVENKQPRGSWKANRKLYDWWKKKMYEHARFGKRYFFVMALAIYAVKCGISEEELRSDANAFVIFMNDLKPDEPFLESDVESALECFDISYATFPRKDIERITGIEIPENKRNKRTRKEHLQAASWTGDDGSIIDNPCKKNREAALKRAREQGLITGRPEGSGTKRELVEAYYLVNPEASLRKAAKDLGISKTTVQKWKPDRAEKRGQPNSL